MIPETQLTKVNWHRDNITDDMPYIKSIIHTIILPAIANDLKKVLGTHLINRNVLLSSSMNSNGSTGYTWTTAYCTLMSIGQMTGTFAKNNNKYDDGEANYKLPLFNFMDIKTGSAFWSRGVCGFDGGYDAWHVNSDGTIGGIALFTNSGVRPLIYIR